ncbi:MAG: hypothetical protein ACKVQR_04690, partial [Aquabacterium sp.]
ALAGGLRDLPPGPFNMNRLAAELQPALDFQRRTGSPLVVGEFGCVRWAPDGSTLRWITDCIALFDSHGWHWCFHSFRTWPGWDAEIDDVHPEATRRTPDAPVMRLLRRALVSTGGPGR